MCSHYSLKNVPGFNAAKSDLMTPVFHALGAHVSTAFWDLISNKKGWLKFTVSGVPHPIDVPLFLAGDWKAVLTYAPGTDSEVHRRRGARGAPLPPQQPNGVNEIANLRNESALLDIVQKKLGELGMDDVVVTGAEIMRLGEKVQLFHRDIAPVNAHKDCATLIWAWDGPRDIGIVEKDQETNELKEVVVRLEMGEALLMGRRTIHRSLGTTQGATAGNVAFVVYLLKEPPEDGGRKRKRTPRNWTEKYKENQGWPLVDGLEALKECWHKDPLGVDLPQGEGRHPHLIHT